MHVCAHVYVHVYMCVFERLLPNLFVFRRFSQLVWLIVTLKHSVSFLGVGLGSHDCVRQNWLKKFIIEPSLFCNLDMAESFQFFMQNKKSL